MTTSPHDALDRHGHDDDERVADRDPLELASGEIRAAAAALTRARRRLAEAADSGDDAETSADRAYAVAELGLLADMALDLQIQVDTARALAETALTADAGTADADAADAGTADAGERAASPAPATRPTSR